MNGHLEKHIPALAGHTILVAGDVILDEYLLGNATRMSREAPIPVLEFESRRLIPGGAANPSANIVALNSHALQTGILGDDTQGHNLRTILTDNGIDTTGLITEAMRPTTVKTRIMAQMGLRFPQQVARLDTLSRDPIKPDTERLLCDFISQKLESTDAVLFSDYHGGLLTESLVKTIKTQARDTILTADAQGNLEKYAGLTLVKCNADDARSYLQQDLQTDADFNGAARELYARLRLSGAMVITRGAQGATLATADNVHHCPAPFVSDVYDTVGAGDTAIAVLTLALAGGISYVEATTLANYASGLVVRKVGNYTPSPDELGWALRTWRPN